jgi:UDP-3-O-[3-hydroxymyristoyl] glucosamine N-acyltransferase
MFFVLLFILLLLMLVAPLVYAYRSENAYDDILHIDHNNTKDPRYFSNSFRNKLSEALKTYDGSGMIQLSNKEEIVFANEAYLFDELEYDKMVICQDTDLNVNQGRVFRKEIFSQRDAVIGKQSIIRSIACNQKLTIDSECSIVRWADAMGICTIGDNCNLGVSSSSMERLVIGKACSFKRVFAPEIHIGVDIEACDVEQDPIIDDVEPLVIKEIARDIKSVDDGNTDDNNIFNRTIITKHDIIVYKGFVVQGDICSHQSVIIDDYVIVHGNIFAEGNIYIGRNSKIYGIVFTQEDIMVHDGAQIGQRGKIKSVVARGDITFGKNCRVYGYVGAGKTGLISPEI